MTRSSAPKSIVIYLPSLIGGGAESAMLRLADGLRSVGYAVEFVVNNATGALADEVTARFAVTDLKASSTLAALPALRDYIRQRQPDILLSALTYNNMLAALALIGLGAKTKLIAVEHSIPSRYLPMHNPISRLIVRLGMRFLYPRAARVIAVSSLAASDLQRLTKMKSDRIAIIHNPVMNDDFDLAQVALPDHPWLRDKTTPVVLGIGRLVPVKNFTLLIDALALLRQKIPARLIILGEGPERAALESHITKLGLQDAVSLPGFTLQVFEHMKAADLLAVSSQWESFGNVVVEALACGTSVVSTPCGGPVEILDKGVYGRLADNAADFAKAMQSALTIKMDNQRLCQRGMHYTIGRAVAAYRDVIESL